MNAVKTRNILMIAVVVTIFVVALVVLIVALVVNTEAGELHEGRRWRQVPVPVVCAGYVPERSEDCSHVSSAIERINRRLGFDAFDDQGQQEELPEGPVVTVVLGAPAEPGWSDPGGVATIRFNDDWLLSCDVRTTNTGSRELLDMTIEHELGHCLNLAHDESNTSIMRRVQRPARMGEYPPRISDHDRALLREIYVD